MKKNSKLPSLIFILLFLVSIFSVLSSLGLIIPVMETGSRSNLGDGNVLDVEDPFILNDLSGAEPPFMMGIPTGYDNFSSHTDINLELIANVTTNVRGFFNEGNGFDIDVGGFNLTDINVSITEIWGLPYQLDTNYGYTDFGNYDIPETLLVDDTYGMSFQVANNISGYLDNFEAAIGRDKATVAQITLYGLIFNATNQTGEVLPDSQMSGTYRSYLPIGAVGVQWLTFEYMTPTLLDVENTHNGTFFIVLSQVATNRKADWAYVDSGSEGIAVEKQGINPWVEINEDFGLRNLQMHFSFPKASEINLTINGTQATDKVIGIPSSAEWVNPSKAIPSSEGTLFYNFSSNFTGGVMIRMKADMILMNETYAEGTFIAKWNDEIVDWNATLEDISYPAISDLSRYNKYANYSFPSTWNISKIFNGTGTDDEITDSVQYTQNNRKICYFGTSNSTFWLNATDLNHISSIGAYNFTDNQTWNPYYMNETLYINSTYTLTEPGNNSFIIYNPNNVSLNSYEKIAENNFTDHTWKINNDSNENGIHHLKVIVKTPMEVGINYTDVNCLKVPTNLTMMTNSSFQVDPGTNVEISVFYNDTLKDDPISIADITIDWPSLYGGYSWNNFGNGYYNITFFTDAALSGSHSVNIDAHLWGFDNGTIQIDIDIISGNDTITNLVDYYYDNGTVNFSTPHPFPDDGLFPHYKPIRVEYAEDGGAGIKAASITAIPDWRGEALQYFDQFTIQEGYYDIYIDTSGLSSYSNYSDIHYVNYTISKYGYDTAIGSFYINVTRINETYLELDTTGFNSLECYQGEEVDLACSFMDLYHAQPITFDEEDPGTVKWMIYNESDPGSYIIAPQEMTRSIIEYQDTIKPYEFNLAPGQYNVTIKTYAIKDYVNYSKNVSLLVKDKLNTTLTYNYTVDPGDELRMGAEISITAHLLIENQSLPEGSRLYNGSSKIIDFEYGNDTYSILTNANGTASLELVLTQYDRDNNFSVNLSYDGTTQIDAAVNTTLTNLTVLDKQNVSLTIAVMETQVVVGQPIQVSVGLFIVGTATPLANRTISVVVMYDFSSENTIVEQGVTGADGYVTITIIIPVDANYIQVYAEYAGESTIRSGQSSLSSSIRVLSILEIFIDNLWWIILIAAVAVGSAFAYHRGIRVPRRQRLIRKQKKVARKMTDSQNLVHIIIIIKESGQSIYNESFGEETINPDLISGFLTAIQAFQSEIKVKKKGLDEEEAGFELNYAQFRILLMDGIYINVALILKDKPTPELKQSLSMFITKFEQKHVNEIKQWDGSLKPFRNTHELLDKLLDLRYQHPITVERYNPKNLGPLEQVLCLISENLQERKKYFTIGDITEKTRDTRPEPNYEIMHDINTLIDKKIFRIQSKDFAAQIKEEEKLNLDSLISQMDISKDGISAVEEKERQSEKEIFIQEAGITGITADLFKQLIAETEYMSYSSIDVLKMEIKLSGSNPEERIKYIGRTLLKNRKKLKALIANDIKKSEKLAEKEKFLEAYDSLKKIKGNLEELGEEVHAKLIAVQISAIIDKFDFEYEMKILRIMAAEHIKSAEKQLSTNKISEGVLFYRKAARIYLELGDIENANKFFELGDDAERACFEE